VLTDVKAVRRRRRREDMEGARYVTRLSRLSAFGAIVAITVAALLMGSAGHASAQSSGWMAAVPLETGVPGNATGANIAADSQGNAIAVWVQEYGNRSDIWANRFVNGPGWGSPTAIETGDDALDISPMVAIDAQGHAIVVWDHCPPPLFWPCTSIHAIRFDPNTGWGLPTTIATWSVGQGSLYAADLAVDGSGTAMVVWEDSNGAVWATRAALGRSWESPTLIGFGARPGLAVSPNGTAIAVWQGAGNYPSYHYPTILAKRFSPGQGWSSPMLLDQVNETGDTYPGPVVAVNAAGVAFATWNRQSSSNTTRSDAWAARFVPGAGWGKATLVGRDSYQRPEVIVDTSGNAIATWNRYDFDSGYHDLMADLYVTGLGWTTATPIALGVGFDFNSGSSAMASDSSGTALVVVSDHHGRINATRWVPGLGWSGPSQIGSGTGEFGIAYGPAIAANKRGIAFAAWTWYDNLSHTSSIWASRYVASDVAPSPLDLLISSPETLLTDIPNVTVSGTTQAGATVQVDGTQVSVDSAGRFSYAIILPDGLHTFFVVAYDASGRVSTKTITVVVDTRAPALTLVSPGADVTTFDGTIEVSGTTEPGTTLVVNGFSAAVALDGSFSVRIGLTEGRNTIGVTATDAAGNVAIRSATVTYVNPFIQDLAVLRLVAIASTVGVVALASLFLVMSIARWARERGGRRGSQNGSRLEEPDGGSSQAADEQKQANGGPFVRGLPVERRWPAKAASVPVRLTAKERILLHLLHFARYADAPEVPRELTQERIVEAAGIDRRHFAQYAHPLVKDGLVRERMARVRGAVQRRRVYVATEEGRNRALGVRDRIRSAMVRIRDDSGIREVTVAEALLEARGSMSVLDILRESIETGVVDLTR